MPHDFSEQAKWYPSTFEWLMEWWFWVFLPITIPLWAFATLFEGFTHGFD